MPGPIVGMILQAAIPAIIDQVRSRPKATPSEIAKAVMPMATKVAAADPVLVNEMNAEPLHRSGTFVGGSITTIGAIAIVAQEAANFQATGSLAGANWAILMPALIALFGGAFTMIRRVGNFKPLSWFGLLRR